MTICKHRIIFVPIGNIEPTDDIECQECKKIVEIDYMELEEEYITIRKDFLTDSQKNICKRSISIKKNMELQEKSWKESFPLPKFWGEKFKKCKCGFDYMDFVIIKKKD